MAYMRMTLANPRPERRQEVRRHFDELVKLVRVMPGCIDAFVIIPHDDSGEIGRVSMWENREAADRAANDQTTMALHAEVNFDVQGHVWDRSFDTVSASINA